MYKTGSNIKKKYDISSATLRKWATNKKVRTVTLPGGKHLYHTSDVDQLLAKGNVDKEASKKRVFYARVASEKQSADLARQISSLKAKYPDVTDNDIYTDTGSGIDFKRPRFVALLERVDRDEICEIVVTDRDRLCRFAYDFVQWFCSKRSVEIVVLRADQANDQVDFYTNSELADDLVGMCNYFVGAANGRRSVASRKRKRESEKNNSGPQNQAESDE